MVTEPPQPTRDSLLTVDWLIGADVLNVPPDRRDVAEQRLADKMLARRHRVTLP